MFEAQKNDKSLMLCRNKDYFSSIDWSKLKVIFQQEKLAFM